MTLPSLRLTRLCLVMSVPLSMAEIPPICFLIASIRASFFRVSSGVIACPPVEDTTICEEIPQCKRKVDVFARACHSSFN